MTRPPFINLRWLLAIAVVALVASGAAHPTDALAQNGGGDETAPEGGTADSDVTGDETAPEGETETDPGDGSETAPSTDEATTPTGVGGTTASETEAGEIGRMATEARLREMATQVDEFKEETFGTKSRLLLLREQVLRRTIAGSKLVVYHVNEMGSEYQLVQALYALDRQRQFSRIDYSGELDDLNEKVVVEQTIVPGSHVLMVELVYKGDPWFLFEYMEGYTFTVRSSYLFEADEGKLHEIAAVAKEDGDFFTAIEDRPTIVYEESTFNLETEGSDASAAATATP